MLDPNYPYTVLTTPIIFEDILRAWIGEHDANLLLTQCAHTLNGYGELAVMLKKYGYDDVIDLVRGIENQLAIATQAGKIALYGKRTSAGHDMFYKLSGIPGLPSYKPYQGIVEHFQFRFYHDNVKNMPSEPMYFDTGEIEATFPFLKNCVVQEPILDDNSLLKTVYIDHNLFQGKKPEQVVNLMQSYDNKFIAHVLVEYNKVDKTKTGRLLYPDQTGAHDDRVYRAYTDKLLKEASCFIIKPVDG